LEAWKHLPSGDKPARQGRNPFQALVRPAGPGSNIVIPASGWKNGKPRHFAAMTAAEQSPENEIDSGHFAPARILTSDT
jgi:hypothetical protein